MKFATFATVATAALGVVSAYDHVTKCPDEELYKFVALLWDNEAMGYIRGCQDASGWQMIPPSGYPTPAQYKLMCGTPECYGLIDKLNSLPPSDCVLIESNGVKFNVKELSESFEPTCFNMTRM